MTYKAIEFFTDLADNRRAYKAGDKYPADGVTVSEARLAELSSNRNARRRPVIAAVAEADEQQEKTADLQAETPTEKPKAKRGRKKAKNAADN